MSDIVEPCDHLLLKRGLYYRPDNCGYTGLKRQAGRYPKSHGRPDSGVLAVHENDAAEYSPACWTETKLADKDARIAQLEAEVGRYREALEGIMIGGNHLALLIGADHPPYTAEPTDALRHYGPSDQYEAWCCWQSIMQGRQALRETADEQR